ncbi:hypothetical protein LENED_003944 [Lentinula edodes]|uniref:Uncharacterized protein n=1 Tax=Lentinula edodes TaxID=5353 RepID=A0A1Q3E4Z0_LENED|nr:hypothetical protein LENED_003944 [Lentinula edodes]
MRFTFASVMFVVVAALFTIFTAEAAAVPRPQARAPEQPVEVVTRAVPESGPIVAKSVDVFMPETFAQFERGYRMGWLQKLFEGFDHGRRKIVLWIVSCIE